MCVEKSKVVIKEKVNLQLPCDDVCFQCQIEFHFVFLFFFTEKATFE